MKVPFVKVGSCRGYPVYSFGNLGALDLSHQLYTPSTMMIVVLVTHALPAQADVNSPDYSCHS